MKIVADQNIPYLSQLLADQHRLVPLAANQITADTVKDADAILVRSVTTVNRHLLANSSVHFVASATAGIDHLDTSFLDDAGIAWAYAPGCNAKAVADYVLLSIIHLMQHNHFKKKSLRAGVIGAGHTGQQVITMLHRLGFEVIVNDPPRSEHDASFLSTPLNQFQALDLICLHTPLITTGPHPTHHLLNSTFLSQLSPSCVIVNAGRGQCIDEQALIASNRTYLLDVWQNEPHINHKVVQSAFIATPHIAGYSQAAKYRATAQIYHAFCQHFGMDIKEIPSAPALQSLTIHLFQDHWMAQALPASHFITLTQQLQQVAHNNPSKIANLFHHLRAHYPLRPELHY